MRQPGSREVIDRLTTQEVEALAAGATLLGSGGGGDVALGARLLRHALVDGPLDVVDPGELTADGVVVHAGIVGAPDVLAERLLDPGDLARAVAAVMRYQTGDLVAIGIIEIGGINAAVGALAAATVGLPVVDGDLMGRAFPRIAQTTLSVAGYPIAPIALVGAAADTVVIPACSDEAAEALVAGCAAAMGGAAALALYPATAGALASVGVRRSLSACVRLGVECLAQRAQPTTDDELAEALGGSVLGDCTVDELRPRVGATPGSVTLYDRGTASVVRLDHLDEFVAVTVDGETVAAAPDVIVAMEKSSRLPLRSDQVRVGQTLLLLRLEPLHRWPAAAMPLIGAGAFGLDLSTAS